MKICIIGGGTTGWMAAAHIEKHIHATRFMISACIVSFVKGVSGVCVCVCVCVWEHIRR